MRLISRRFALASVAVLCVAALSVLGFVAAARRRQDKAKQPVAPAPSPTPSKQKAPADLWKAFKKAKTPKVNPSGPANCMNGSVWLGEDELRSLNADNNDQDGYSIAVDGDRAAIGSPYADANGLTDAGAVYIFERSNGFWTQTARLLTEGQGFNSPQRKGAKKTQAPSAPAAAGDNFGFSVALDGNYLVVGAPNADGRFADMGAAYVFERLGAGWEINAVLSDNSGTAGQNFGYAVALDGNRALASAPFRNTGTVYVAEIIGVNWQITDSFFEETLSGAARFGSALALQGNRALVGADNAFGQGRAFVVDFDGNGWSTTAVFNGNNPQAGSAFGAAVDLDGNDAIVGAPLYDDGGNSDAGEVSIFHYDGANWTRNGALTLGDTSQRFGASVAVSGDTALIGAPDDDFPGAANAGKGYVYERNGSGWLLDEILTPPTSIADDRFGTAAALDGDTALVTAPMRDFGEAMNRGAGFAFLRVCNEPPDITPQSVTAQQASIGSPMTIATLNDDFTFPGALTVTITNLPPGLSVSPPANTGGTVTATIEAGCGATVGDNIIQIQVTDDLGATATANIPVTVTANTPPVLGSYSDATANAGGSTTVTPSAAPVDNGLISLNVAASGGFTGSLSIDSQTGVVSVSNAGPAGTFPVTVTATDACNLSAQSGFNLTVTGAGPTITPAAAVSRQQGSGSATSMVATVSDGVTPAGELIVTALNVPPGLTVSGINNIAGNVTANIAANCAANTGANNITFQVTNGNSQTATADFTVNVTANTPPALGSYSDLGVNLGGGGNAPPSAEPSDNGSVSSLTVAASGGFTGSLSVSPETGVVSFSNAGPAGSYTVTVTGTDNCGATSQQSFTLNVNAAPTITPAAPVSTQQGNFGGSNFPVATVGDDFTPAGGLIVTATGVPAGITVSNIVNTDGAITADIAAGCAAAVGNNQITLRAQDEEGLFSTADFTVNVTANTPPTLGSYAGTVVAVNGSTTVTPSAPPTENGSFNSVTVAASGGFTGSLAVDNRTGVVTVANAAPAGSYNVTVTATDNCGAVSQQSFTLNVNGAPVITPAAAVSRQQGSPVANSPVATISDDLTPVGSLTVSAQSVPPGLVLNNLVNANGAVTADIVALCGATSGANTIVLEVRDEGGLTATANFTVNVTANTAPALGTYANANANPGGSTTVTPSAAPSDNGSISSLTASASGGFTGNLSVNAAGVVSVTNAAPSGNHTVTVTATDNCGAVTTANFMLAVNGAPSITPATPLTRQQGSAGAVSPIATVSDDNTAANSLSVTAVSVPAGLIINGITNSNGAITANIAADCSATVGANTITLQVADGDSLTSTANLTVNVTANTAPALGAYANTGASVGGAATVTPSAAPSDNGSVANVTVAASGGFTGNVSVNAAGVVSIANAGPAGTYTITVTATDNCGATTNASFNLTVNAAPGVTPAAPLSRQQGSAGSVSAIATISDDLTPAGSLNVSVSNVPAGLTVNGLTNNNGAVSANVAADCAATVGANTFTLNVTDGAGLSSGANVTVNVTANTAPTLGSYAAAILSPGGSATVTPSAAPADNGSVASVTVSASAGFTGNLSVDSPGAVSITNAGPSGTYTVTVTAADNCGATTTASFNLTVNAPPTITPASAVARQQGSAGGVSPVAVVSDDLTPAGGLTVTASNVPAGLSVANISNNNGNVTAEITAGCAASPGANAVTFTVTDAGGLSSGANFTVNVAVNTPPALGVYGNTALNAGASVSVTPSASPADNGSVASVTVAASNGFTGAVSVNAAGVVTITNAAPSGVHAITITAADNCGATSTASFNLTVNAAPTVTPAAALARQAGSAGATSPLAGVSDDLTAAGSLSVAVSNVPAGLTVANLANNNGAITADVTAACAATAGANSFTLTVTDAGGLSASTAVTVNIAANTAPTLGNYSSVSLMPGGSTTVTPTAPPADNGSISSVTVSASAGYTGILTVDAQTGVVSANNSAPSGSYAITVTATDNCGATTSANFTLNINGSPNITPAANATRQQGSAGAVAAVAIVSDDLTPAANLTVVASNVPAGLSISNIVNNNGNITANIAAGCAATVGANVIALTVTDGQSLSSSANFTVNVTVNTPPALGVYAATPVNSGASTTVTPGVAPNDNGSLSLAVAASNGFTGNVSVNAAGAVSISNATPSGSHTITVTATDNCGATASTFFVLTVNNAPAVNVAAPLARQQGSAGFTSTLATISDDQTPAGSLTVAAASVPNGLTLNGLANNNGAVSAQVTAACGAAVGANTIVLTVTDGGGLTTNANVTVNVTPNAPPVLGAYTAATVGIGQARAVTPAAPPADNGAIAGVAVAVSSGFTGTVAVNAETGVVLVNNAGPAGSHTVTVTATDNCGATVSANFTLQVAAPTLARIENFAAYRAAQGNTIRWQSSYEVDNLGFNVYRQEGKRRIKLTPALIAGSALSVGPNALTAGDSYAWRDAEGQANSVYWVEDIDLKGRREMHGPLAVRDEGEDLKDEAKSALISDLPTNSGAVREYPQSLNSSTQSPTPNPQPLTSNLQLAARPAVKIAVRAAGWHRVTGAQLQAAGLDLNTDAARLQLYADGVEQAIQARAANGADSGPLGLDGAIEFYGLAQDTRESDTRFYWLIAGAAPGLRIGPPARVAPRGAGERESGRKGEGETDLAGASFAYTVERRERLAYFPALRNGDAENFFGAMVNDAAPVAQALTVNNLDAAANQPATVSVALQGLTQTPHRVRVALNGADLGVVSFSGQELKTARFSVPQSALAEGANAVTYIALDGAADVSAIAYTRVTYARRYRAENDRLSFTGNGSTHLRVEGFTTPNARVFDVTDPQRVFELAAQTVSEAAGYTVIVNGGAGRHLIAVANAQTPAGIAANAPSNWTSADKRADLLILAHRDFMSAAEPLANLRRSQGLETVIIDVADIYDEWNGGAADTEALRGFLRWTQQNWQRAPRYLLLMGDASYDPRGYFGGNRTDFVPTRLVDTNAAETASDEGLADFDGDGLGEFAVGRLPARTSAQAQTMVNKLLNYTPGQAQGALFVADQADGYDFAAANRQLRAELPAAMPAGFINRGGQPDSNIRAELLNALNAGPSLVTYAGHGAPEAWAGLIFNSANANGLTNGARLPFVVTLTCLNGAFQHPQQETLAESLLRAPNGGALAVWASSGMTMPNEQMPMARELYRRLYQADAPLLGDALRAAKASVEFAEIRQTWILFGDPTLRLR